MVHTQQMQHRGLKIVDVDAIFSDIITEVIGFYRRRGRV